MKCVTCEDWIDWNDWSDWRRIGKIGQFTRLANDRKQRASNSSNHIAYFSYIYRNFLLGCTQYIYMYCIYVHLYLMFSQGCCAALLASRERERESSQVQSVLYCVSLEFGNFSQPNTAQ